MVLKRILSIGARRADRLHAVPDGQRIYAIGDVHGCLGLLDDLIAKIDADDAARGKARTRLIFLGDLVDRGPDSRGVVERVRRIHEERPGTILLKGNHEEILLLTRQGDRRAASLFHRVGGRATLLSYGVPADVYDSCDTGDLADLVRQYVPDEHIALLSGFEDFHEAGDYLFVHAGIRPGIPLAEQKISDLRWIRSEFLNHKGSHGRVVVHGHSISVEVEERPNRIGIDTGGFASGQLTAVGLEGSNRWYLSSTLS
jgi:serine/threonine protein phosphatase 1